MLQCSLRPLTTPPPPAPTHAHTPHACCPLPRPNPNALFQVPLPAAEDDAYALATPKGWGGDRAPSSRITKSPLRVGAVQSVTHSHTHTQSHTQSHTHSHTRAHAHTRSHTHARARICVGTGPHASTAPPHTHKIPHTCTHRDTCTLSARARARMRTARTCTRIRTGAQHEPPHGASCKTGPGWRSCRTGRAAGWLRHCARLRNPTPHIPAHCFPCRAACRCCPWSACRPAAPQPAPRWPAHAGAGTARSGAARPARVLRTMAPVTSVRLRGGGGACSFPDAACMPSIHPPGAEGMACACDRGQRGTETMLAAAARSPPYIHPCVSAAPLLPIPSQPFSRLGPCRWPPPARPDQDAAAAGAAVAIPPGVCVWGGACACEQGLCPRGAGGGGRALLPQCNAATPASQAGSETSSRCLTVSSFCVRQRHAIGKAVCSNSLYATRALPLSTPTPPPLSPVVVSHPPPHRPTAPRHLT